MLFTRARNSGRRTSTAAMATLWQSDTSEQKRREHETCKLLYPTATSETTPGKLPSSESI